MIHYVIYKNIGGNIVETPIKFGDLPEEVKNMFRIKRINFVEKGFCPDLSNFRGYQIKNNELTQMTGTTWAFRAFCAYEKKEG